MTGPERTRASPRWLRWVWLSAYALALLVAAELVLRAASARFEAPVGFHYVPYVGDFSSGSSPDDAFTARHACDETSGSDAQCPSVWLFGGSTMVGNWGDRAGEGGSEPTGTTTIPGHLSELLREAGIGYDVYNFGHVSFNSNQERILFTEVLSRYAPPKIAIFYDGANETRSTAPFAGYPHNYPQIRDILGRRASRFRFRSGMAQARFKLAFFADYLLNSRGPEDDINPYRAARRGSEEYVADIVDNYAHNLRTIDLVCREFGIECYFVWQPTLCFKPDRTPDEEEAYALGCSQYFPDERTRAAVRADERIRAHPRFLDLSDLFADESEGIFIDDCHIDGASRGERTIAAAIRDAVDWR